MYYYLIGIWIGTRILHDVSTILQCSWYLSNGVIKAGKYVLDNSTQINEIKEENEMFTLILPDEEDQK